MARTIYNLLLYALSPLLFLYSLWRILIVRKANESWRENLGFLPKLCDRPADEKLIWIHAVSVGEVVASLPLQDELRRLMPNAKIFLTTITQPGNAIARKSAKSADVIGYLPMDFPLFVSNAVGRVKPDILVLTEAEFWPNLIGAMKKNGVPVVLINGRISNRTMSRARWAPWLIKNAVSKLANCCMQTETDAKRMISLGAKPECVHTIGNLKFDQEGGKLTHDAVKALRSELRLPNDVPVFVAGSSNPGEEEHILEAFKLMREENENLRLIIAPRQIDRGEEIERLVQSMGFRTARRSIGIADSEYDVLILDTLGELAAVYSVGEIAFVGGTLIPKGGHSIIQPILQGKPVFFGPHTFKTHDIARLAISSGVGFEVKNGKELGMAAKNLLADKEKLQEISGICDRLVSENKGVSERCARIIAESLGMSAEV